MVYDLFGNGKTAVKYSLNRYNLARTTGVASNYNPLLSQTATLQWRDVNGDDIAQGERGCNYGLPALRLRDQLRRAAIELRHRGARHLRRVPRTWNLENGLELQHELLPNLSVQGSWYRAASTTSR